MKSSVKRAEIKKTGEILVEISPDFFRPAEVDLLIGNASKAKDQIGWEPKTDLRELVCIMMQHDLKDSSDKSLLESLLKQKSAAYVQS